MCGWLRASMSGLTRSATRAVVCCICAIDAIRCSSPADSALMTPDRSEIARSSSASVLPTPVNTICDGRNPARSATSISPPELASAAAAELAQQARNRQRRVGLQRVVEPVRIAARALRRAPGRRLGSCRRRRRRPACPTARPRSRSESRNSWQTGELRARQREARSLQCYLDTAGAACLTLEKNGAVSSGTPAGLLDTFQCQPIPRQPSRPHRTS